MMTRSECIKYVEDHMEIRYATKNGAYLSGKTIKPMGCVNHSIGVAQPSTEVIFKNMNSSNANWGVNAILGDFHLGEGKILVTLKDYTRPWGCGQGDKGSWNNSKVQWEVCEPKGHTYQYGRMVNYDVEKNQLYFDRMWKMLVAWNVYMIDKYGYPVSGISDHAEAYKAGYGSNHSDMGQWLPKHGKSMDILRKEVRAILEHKEDEEMPIEKFVEHMNRYRDILQDNDASEYSEEARKWALDTGLIVGSGTDSNGEPNAMWGDFLTREQFVTVLYRFAKLFGKV